MWDDFPVFDFPYPLRYTDRDKKLGTEHRSESGLKPKTSALPIERPER